MEHKHGDHVHHHNATLLGKFRLISINKTREDLILLSCIFAILIMLFWLFCFFVCLMVRNRVSRSKEYHHHYQHHSHGHGHGAHEHGHGHGHGHSLGHSHGHENEIDELISGRRGKPPAYHRNDLSQISLIEQNINLINSMA